MKGPKTTRSEAEDSPAAASSASPSFVVLALTRLRSSSIGWGLWQLAASVLPASAPKHLLFDKTLGSGREAGFGLAPGLDHQGYLAAFNDPMAAESFFHSGDRLAAYAAHAIETAVFLLAPYSVRGSWSGHRLVGSPALAVAAGQPIAALTRASIRPHKAAAFWARSPAAEADLKSAQGCRLAAGLGEAPLLRQATFSVWESTEAMTHYAHSGGHHQAIASAYANGFFSETMFVRFRILAARGQWQGSPASALCQSPQQATRTAEQAAQQEAMHA